MTLKKKEQVEAWTQGYLQDPSALGDYAAEILDALTDGVSSPHVNIIEDASDRPWNAIATLLLVADIQTAEGPVRVGYYQDGGVTVVDLLDPAMTLADWCAAWCDNNAGALDTVPQLVREYC